MKFINGKHYLSLSHRNVYSIKILDDFRTLRTRNDKNKKVYRFDKFIVLTNFYFVSVK